MPGALLLMCVAGMGGGCSTSNVVTPRHAPTGLDLAQGPVWPASSYRASVEAFGGPQTIATAPSEAIDLSQYLKPEVAAKSSTDKPTVKRAAKVQAIVPAPKTVLPPEVTDSEPAQVAIAVAPVVSAAASPPDADRYAARDQQSKEQKSFRGGDAIVVTSGAILLILLVVLLVLLLT